MWDLSSLTRARTHIPCIGRWILNHWTTREVQKESLFKVNWLIQWSYVTESQLSQKCQSKCSTWYGLQHNYLLAQQKIGTLLLSRTTLTRESRDFCWADIALAADSVISSRVKERSLIIASFVLTLSLGRRDLPKEAKFESWCLLVISVCVCDLRLERWQPGKFKGL